jgi:hypothetical protein
MRDFVLSGTKNFPAGKPFETSVGHASWATEGTMKRRERQRREKDGSDDQRLAPVGLGELREAWESERATRTRRVGEVRRLMRLAAETREMLALWSCYRLACLEAMDSGQMGMA